MSRHHGQRRPLAATEWQREVRCSATRSSCVAPLGELALRAVWLPSVVRPTSNLAGSKQWRAATPARALRVAVCTPEATREHRRSTRAARVGRPSDSIARASRPAESPWTIWDDCPRPLTTRSTTPDAPRSLCRRRAVRPCRLCRYCCSPSSSPRLRRCTSFCLPDRRDASSKSCQRIRSSSACVRAAPRVD